jgi:hypothetical protein
MRRTGVLILIILAFSSVSAQNHLLSQGFENGPYTADSLPLKWAKFKINGPGLCSNPPLADWRVRDSGKVFCATQSLPGYRSKAYKSRKSLSIPWTSTSGSVVDDWVFTDSVVIRFGDSLKFWIQLGTWPDGQAVYLKDSLQVWVSTVKNPTGGQKTKLGTIVSLPQPMNVWQYKTFNLSQFAWQKIYVAFRYYMNISVDGLMVNIDSVMIGNLGGAVGNPLANYNIPGKYDLKQNYPNPFNPATTIEFDLPHNEYVYLAVYNTLGQLVAVLVNEIMSAGSHSVNFDLTNLPCGIYAYKMTAGEFMMTRKMSIVK